MPITLNDWIQGCAFFGLFATAGQWAYNDVLRPLLADIFDWRELTPDETIPPLIWLAASGAVFGAVAVLFIGHAAGFD